MLEPVLLDLPDEAATARLAQRMAPALAAGGVIYLEGDLGSGKTTLARALLRALGVTDRVKSPTYSLVERYDLPALTVWHLDLYRIADPGELEWLGLDAIDAPASLTLIEWPQRGAGRLPPPHLRVVLRQAADGRIAELFATDATPSLRLFLTNTLQKSDS
jgi:tRNA threonylcarbamoyladenosine biosynthesis protein TsaE